MNKPWLSIVGLGDDGLAGLGAAAHALIDNAEVLIGGERHLAMLPPDTRERLAWPSPLKALLSDIEQRQGQRVCVLASGDPMCYGIGVTLAQRIAIEEMMIVPAPSAFSLACARLGWSCCEVETLSLHGRPLELFNNYLQPGAKLLLLSHDCRTPSLVAERLQQCGFAASRLTVLEHLGGVAERIVSATAQTWSEPLEADLNTVAVECVADADTVWYPRTPGLPDDAFQHDGQISKREVRAATLALLQPSAGQLLWDVGAGAGSVAIEWLRASRSCAIAIERNPTRGALLLTNAESLGVPHLQYVKGSAPAALVGLTAPDAVFIGGGITSEGMLETCWEALKPGGRLVANAVTLESEAVLLQWRQRLGGELSRITVSRAAPVGAYHGWRTLMPVTQFAVSKRKVA